jgi:hypothetical protein
MTSLTHPRKILLVEVQIGKYKIEKAKDLSTPLRIVIARNIAPVILMDLHVFVSNMKT